SPPCAPRQTPAHGPSRNRHNQAAPAPPTSPDTPPTPASTPNTTASTYPASVPPPRAPRQPPPPPPPSPATTHTLVPRDGAPAPSLPQSPHAPAEDFPRNHSCTHYRPLSPQFPPTHTVVPPIGVICAICGSLFIPGSGQTP